jgi:hypothetical protein
MSNNVMTFQKKPTFLTGEKPRRNTFDVRALITVTASRPYRNTHYSSLLDEAACDEKHNLYNHACRFRIIFISYGLARCILSALHTNLLTFTY